MPAYIVVLYFVLLRPSVYIHSFRWITWRIDWLIDWLIDWYFCYIHDKKRRLPTIDHVGKMVGQCGSLYCCKEKEDIIVKVRRFTTTCTISAYQNQCEFKNCSWQGVLDITLCDKVCQWLAAGLWFSPVIPVSSTNKIHFKILQNFKHRSSSSPLFKLIKHSFNVL
jgi:hypothetical protein